jgi:hypothetical protein
VRWVPKYRLADVHAAVLRGDFGLGRGRCLNFLMEESELFDTPTECRRFARDVLLALTPLDFSQIDQIPHPRSGEVEDFDRYGIEISDALLKKHHLVCERTWFVRITLRENERADSIFCISLHDLEHPMRRVGGMLFPKWKPKRRGSQ